MTLPLASKRVRTFTARPYQVAARERVEEAWAAGIRAPMLVMATGTGKTKTALHIASGVEGRVVWLAHRQELLDQPMGELWFGTESAGIVQADRDASDARIVFASVQTLAQAARVEGCTRRDPCEARSQLDLVLTPEGTCSLLLRGGAWMLMDEGRTVVAAISHCPWCGRVLA